MIIDCPENALKKCRLPFETQMEGYLITNQKTVKDIKCVT